MKNLDYRWIKSTEFLLVLLAFIAACGFLAVGTIGETTWRDIVLGGVFGYVIARVGAKASEAMRDKNVPPQS